MSVLIKGVKMPKECNVGCPVSGIACNLWWKSSGGDIPADCPIIELPEHGDLIDRDVVVMRLAEWSKRLIETYGENDEYVNCLSEVLEGLGCDDVIIPAERSEE